MQSQASYQPSFNRVQLLKRAVTRIVRRRKALGQYIIVANKGKIERIEFALKTQQRTAEQNNTHHSRHTGEQVRP